MCYSITKVRMISKIHVMLCSSCHPQTTDGCRWLLSNSWSMVPKSKHTLLEKSIFMAILKVSTPLENIQGPSNNNKVEKQCGQSRRAVRALNPLPPHVPQLWSISAEQHSVSQVRKLRKPQISLEQHNCASSTQREISALRRLRF